MYIYITDPRAWRLVKNEKPAKNERTSNGTRKGKCLINSKFLLNNI